MGASALLPWYQRELRHLRDGAREFAQAHPKVAARLGLDAPEGGACADPYVERLLEGFAFLAARIHYQLDAGYPRFTAHLLDQLLPHYQTPTPSMMVVQLLPDLDDPALALGPTVPRESLMSVPPRPGGAVACRFRTGHAVRLWPLCVASAGLVPANAASTHAAGVAAAPRTGPRAWRATLSLHLDVRAGLAASQLALDELVLHVAADDALAPGLYELLAAHVLGVDIVDMSGASGPGGRRIGSLPAAAVRAIGFDASECLLPATAAAFEGLRLMREYAACPARFLFFCVSGLRPHLASMQGASIVLRFLLDRHDDHVASALDATAFALHATPVVNLFPKRADRLELSAREEAHRVVPDRVRPDDFEVFAITRVAGLDASGVREELALAPLATARARGACYTARRAVRRLASSSAGGEPGTDVWITVGAGPEAADVIPAGVSQLAVDTLCSQRDAPLRPGSSVGDGLRLESHSPVRSVRALRSPTRPLPAPPEGESSWAVLNHLTRQHLSLPEGGVAALREWLLLLAPGPFTALHRQLDGLVHLRCTPEVFRVPRPGPQVFASGVAVHLTIDERAFDGCSALMFGAVLQRLLARHASLNACVELTLVSATRGPLHTWPPMPGDRPWA